MALSSTSMFSIMDVMNTIIDITMYVINYFLPTRRFSQALIDMGVSGSFIPTLPIKRVIGEGGHGLLGVISASMVIYEEYTKEKK
jgi:hypothetical protein